MTKESDSTNTSKMATVIELFKNTKFLIVNALVLIVLAIALVSGDGKKIALNFYEKVTGSKYETFSPVDDISHPAYIALKDKVFRDLNVSIEKTGVTVFKESDTLHKYRVESSEVVYFYKVEKRADGVWMINHQK